MMTCLYCGQAFEAKRKDAKFCSAKCRVAQSRNTKSVTAKCNTIPVTDNLPTDPAELLSQYELIKITTDVGTNNESVQTISLTAWFDSRPGPTSLLRDYDDLRNALGDYDREILIQEIVAYRADLDELRAVRTQHT